MRKFYVSMGVLFLLVFSLICGAQEGPGVSPRAIPEMPDEITIESSVGNVIFPHNLHVDGVSLGCNACHHQIHATALDTPHPDYLTSSWISCQGCHQSVPEATSEYYKCSDCHHSEPANIADETLSSKVVTHKSCWKCHRSGTGVEASKGCNDCHVKEEN